MSHHQALPAPDTFRSFGDLLRYLRRRERLTQAELGRMVGYSDAQICRLEKNRRVPDDSTLAALFWPALQLHDAPGYGERLLVLAAEGRGETTASAVVAPTPTVRPSRPNTQPQLIGRMQEQRALHALVAQGARLITVTGSPGVGKTSLALAVATELATAGLSMTVVDLAAVTDAALVAEAMARALGVIAEVTVEQRAPLVDALATEPRLLVLDNFEQVLPAAPLLAEMLDAVPGLQFLVTSRAALHLPHEQVFPLVPLELPDIVQLPALPELAQIPAVAFLVMRLQQAEPDFELTTENARTIAEICVRTDGVPLALELVAARGRLLAPAELLELVAHHHQLVAQRYGTGSERHQSLAEALNLSFELLGSTDQMLFMRLAVFVGGWTFAAVRTVFGSPGDNSGLLNGLETLLDHNLIQRRGAATETRFTLLVMVREFALERLAAAGALHATQQRHAIYYLGLAEEAAPHLFDQASSLWLQRLEDELDNLRAAIQWALDHDLALGMRVVSALELFWHRRGHSFEGRRWIESLLARHATTATLIPDETLAGALFAAGLLAFRNSDYAVAEAHLHASLAVWERHDDRSAIARVLNNLGNIALAQGTYDLAAKQYQASLALRRKIGDLFPIASTLNNLAEVTRLQGDLDQASLLFHESLELYRRIAEPWSVASVLSNLATIALHQGHLEQATALYEESDAVRADLGDIPGRATTLNGLGAVARARGDYAGAREYYRTSLDIQPGLPQVAQTAIALVGLAAVALAVPMVQRGEQAARLLGAALALLERHQVIFDPDVQSEYEELLARTAAILGERPCRSAWNAGRALPLEQVLALARSVD